MWRMYFTAILIYKARRIGQTSHLAELFNTRRRIDFDSRVDRWNTDREFIGAKPIIFL